MKILRTLASGIFLFPAILSAQVEGESFPSFNYKTVSGETIDNSTFNGKKSVVIIGHLNCPPMKTLLGDLQAGPVEGVQPILILENSPQQFRDFNSVSDNPWSRARVAAGLQPVTGTVITECDDAKVDKEVVITEHQCRKLGTALNAMDSPTLFYVNESGKITRVVRGYFDDDDRDDRLELLRDLALEE